MIPIECIEAPEPDFYVCLCDNRPHRDGFQPVDQYGFETHPDQEWSGLLWCARCGRTVDTSTRDPTAGTVRVV